ncbi:hypothetical protein DPMN_147827 [Dreissena polymorpha]|uniref:Uncharacterized protein n=1 Tax=Dreissena polymorpha TaxID=45954 RepID=A0A9D4FAJ6_DREPO|nr:hypothetical protein DPMN_147827 [Dreissena polymorpha]
MPRVPPGSLIRKIGHPAPGPCASQIHIQTGSLFHKKGPPNSGRRISQNPVSPEV